MRYVCLVFIFCISLPCLAQEQIGKTRADVRKYMGTQLLKSSKEDIRTIEDHDSTITLKVREKSSDMIISYEYSFNVKGTCTQEKIYAEKEEWITPLLNAILAKKEFGFKKINEHQYISLFDKKVFLELPPEGSVRSFNMFRVDWSRDMYDILSKSENGVKE